MISVPAAIVDAICAHVRTCYPSEACGVLFADGGSETAVRFVPQDNVADKYHAMDPVEYPRTSRDYFQMNEAKLGRLVREVEAAGGRWLAIVHSHIDCGAYFSREDIAAAAPDGACVYPDLYQIVVDARSDGIREARAFRWDGAAFADRGPLPHFPRTA
jgi:proteasome lid subunit RPN8/RPN11